MMLVTKPFEELDRMRDLDDNGRRRELSNYRENKEALKKKRVAQWWSIIPSKKIQLFKILEIVDGRR